MDDRVREVMSQAGWFPGRRVEIDLDRAALLDDGYAGWKLLDDFLAEFSGIEATFLVDGDERDFWFGAARAIETAFSSRVASYGEIVGQPLAPIGYANRDHLLLTQSMDGRFFASYDDLFLFLGSSIDEMLSSLVTQNMEPFAS